MKAKEIKRGEKFVNALTGKLSNKKDTTYPIDVAHFLILLEDVTGTKLTFDEFVRTIRPVRIALLQLMYEHKGVFWTV